MHYSAFAFRESEISGLAAQFTRTIYINPLSWHSWRVGLGGE